MFSCISNFMYFKFQNLNLVPYFLLHFWYLLFFLFIINIFSLSSLSIIIIAALKLFSENSNIWFISRLASVHCLFLWEWVTCSWLLAYQVILNTEYSVMLWRLWILLYFSEEWLFIVCLGRQLSWLKLNSKLSCLWWAVAQTSVQTAFNLPIMHGSWVNQRPDGDHMQNLVFLLRGSFFLRFPLTPVVLVTLNFFKWFFLPKRVQVLCWNFSYSRLQLCPTAVSLTEKPQE